MKSVSEVSLAYIAGFCDGEGSISIGIKPPRERPRRKTTRFGFILQVTIVNTNRQVLEWIREVCGIGSLHHQKTSAPNRLLCHRFVVTDYAAEQFLRAISPYVRVKQEQTRLALEFRALGQATPFKAVPDENVLRAYELKELMHKAKGPASSINRAAQAAIN